MLIDLEKYVRQLLPPNRREPIHIGLSLLLFHPIEAIIRAFNDYVYDSQFDTGTPGQVGVLEYLLQVYVDPNARVIESDGVLYDFVVLVATPSQHGKARKLIDRHKLAGKRYDVATQVSWGGGVTGGFGFLAGLPTVSSEIQGQWVIAVGVNEAGRYLTRFVNQSTGKVFVGATLEYTGSNQFQLAVDQPGTYKITVGVLTAFVTAVAGGLVCDLVYLDQVPGESGAQSLAMRWQAGVRQLFIHLYSSRADLQPFTTKIRSGATIVHQFNWNAPQGQWHNLPTIADGSYTVEVVDKQGCVTSQRAITFTAEPAPGTLTLGTINVTLVSGIYRVEVNFTGGTPGHVVEVLTSDDVQIVNGLATDGAQKVLNLPSNTPSQIVKVRVTDSLGASVQDTSVTLPGASCDLVYRDQHPGEEGLPSLAMRWQAGVRQLFIHLYSSRADLQPFTTKIRSGATIVHTFTWNNPQGQWHNLPTIADGAYTVEVTDKQGCQTSQRAITFAAQPAQALAIGSVVVTKIGEIFRLLVNVSGGTAPYTLAVLNAADGTIISVSSVPSGQKAIDLPSGTLPQTVKVRATDAVSAQVTYSNVVLGTGNLTPVILSKGYTSLMDIEITGSPGSWLITDKSNRSPQSGYQWWYYVGSKLIKTSSRLVNEPWQGNHPGRVMKLSVKTTVTELWRWSTFHPGNPDFDPNAGQYFDKGDTGAVTTFFFKEN
jgi:hypothetical protein